MPLVAVDITINLNNPQFLNISSNTVGYVYLTGGSQGIIVFRNIDEFMAYDRHSPFQPQNDCRVSVSDDGVTVIDDPDCSDSSWLIYDGSVISGPAAAPLQQYQTSYNPPYLRIYN